jgi:hypothetical protein
VTDSPSVCLFTNDNRMFHHKIAAVALILASMCMGESD